MRAMVLEAQSNFDEQPEPLVLRDVPRPDPGPGELLVKVDVCGVCHTELDVIEGRTPPPVYPIIPGHEVVGRVHTAGRGADRYSAGDRVGIGWIHSSDGTETENLSSDFRATGRDADGGYAEFIVVPQSYAYPVPGHFSDEQAAPLLCAGGVGFRALRLARLRDGMKLGLTGFGGSGHLVLQLAKHLYPASPVFVFARSADEREFAIELGADWSGDTAEAPPALLDAIIDTTPVWTPVIAALAALAPGGRLVINAIRKEDADQGALTSLDYEQHLWLEKEIKTVANVTARDIAEFLPIAADIPIEVSTQTYPLEEANRALTDLRRGGLRGAKVLKI